MRNAPVNNLGWCYFGPTVTDGNGEVRVIFECLCYIENHDLYAWGLTVMEEFELNYKLVDTRFLFADNKATNQLLLMLKISESCTLRADSYHCLEIDWPDLFGEKTWTEEGLHVWVKRMIYGTEGEWHQSFLEAKKIVSGNNDQFQHLKK